MIEQDRTHGSTGAPHWLLQLLSRFSGEYDGLERGAGPAETFLNERPVDGQFCTHGRLTRLIARWRSRLGLTPYRIREIDGGRICSLCGRLPADRALTVYVLSVEFRDGDVSEYTFESPYKHDCYHLSDETLHIYLPGSSVSYALDVISSINFGARVVPPVPVEVLEAERIIAERTPLGW